MTDPNPALELRDLTFGYSRGSPLFSGFSRQFDGGRAYALRGPSGGGKSTLLYLLGLLLTPQRGQLLVQGRDVSRLSDVDRSALRGRHIGLVFQDAVLDASRSILDNILEGVLYAGQQPASARRRALDMLDHFGVTAAPDRRPSGISGGQAQRVGLCRALIKRPSIILADEPTANVDEATGEVVLTALLDAARHDHACVIVATHNAAVATRVDEEIWVGVDAA